MIGQVDEERTNVIARNVEGLDDDEQRAPAPRGRNRNRTRRQNVHIGNMARNGSGFGPLDNNPSSRYNNINNAFVSVDRLVSVVSRDIDAPPVAPPRTAMEIANDYAAARRLHSDAAEPADQLFYASVLGIISRELGSIETNTNNQAVNRNEENENNSAHATNEE